jgi:hypothetical protein
MTRQEALDLEEFLNREAQNPKHQSTAFYQKNDKKHVRPLRSIGGAPGTPAEEKVHAVYISWGRRGERALPPSRREESQAGGNAAKVSVFYKDDAGFLKALETRGTFFASTRKGAKPGNQPPQVHFHKKDCPKWKLTRRGRNPNPYTSIRIKVTTTSVAALYQWMQEQYPERFSHRHVCTWCNISTFMRRRIGAERLCMTKRAAIMSRRPRGSYIGGHTVIKLGKSRPEPKQRSRDQSAVDAPNKPKPPPSKKYWALRILRLVKIHAITQEAYGDVSGRNCGWYAGGTGPV